MGSYSAPTFCDTLAAMGTADTPADPISGLTLPLVTAHISLPNKIPITVPRMNAIRPSRVILRVLTLRKASALVVAPTDVPSRITTIYIIAFEVVSVSCFTTPDSLKRLPSMSIPIRGAVVGRIIHTTRVTTMGKRIFSSFVTCLSCGIRTLRSFSVVSSFMKGGCMTGTRDIYEYAATAMGPRSVPPIPSFPARKMDVGPSAPPMIEMAAASFPVKPKAIARK